MQHLSSVLPFIWIISALFWAYTSRPNCFTSIFTPALTGQSSHTACVKRLSEVWLELSYRSASSRVGRHVSLSSYRLWKILLVATLTCYQYHYRNDTYHYSYNKATPVNVINTKVELIFFRWHVLIASKEEWGWYMCGKQSQHKPSEGYNYVRTLTEH